MGFGHQVRNISYLWKTWHCLNGTSKHNSFEYRHLAIGLFSRAVSLDYPVRVNGKSPYLSCHLTRSSCSYVKYLVQCLDYYSGLFSPSQLYPTTFSYLYVLLFFYPFLLSPCLCSYFSLCMSLSFFACTQCLFRRTGIWIWNLYSPMTVSILYSGKTIKKLAF